MPAMPNQLAYLTADLPGIGGVIKQRHEDFIVTELPLYEPCGEGEHLYLFVQKTNLTTKHVASQIARVLNVSPRAINFAGMKDKHAITRQMFSLHLPGTASQDTQRVALLEGEPFTVLWADRHHNKLRRGHLLGNRFDLRIRNVEPTAVIRAKKILDRLVAQGVPNYFGPQRFGSLANNHLVGRALIKDDDQEVLDQLLGLADQYDHEPTYQARQAYDAGDYERALTCWPRALRYEYQVLAALTKGQSIGKALRCIDKQQRQFFASATQSYLFNQVLNQRVMDKNFSELLPGDLAIKHENHSVFAVDEDQAAAENAADGRITLGEISPSGPMWGSDLLLPKGELEKLECSALESFEIPRQTIQASPLTQGSRRPLRVMIQNPDISGGVDEHGSYVHVQFELGKGSFATVVLSELMKNQVDCDLGEA